MSLNEAALNGAGTYRPSDTPRRVRELAAGDRSGPRRLGLQILETLDAERGRWFLWLPVFYGLGIAIYFALSAEPPLAPIIAAVVIATILRMFLHATALRLIFSTALLMVSLGLLTAKTQALRVDAPALKRDYRYIEVEGWVEKIERHESRTRLTLRLIRAEKIAPELMPRRVRISVRGKGDPVPLGKAIKLRVTLMPPPEPAQPGGFDFARFFWFQGIGASGYAMSKIEPVAAPPPPPWDLSAIAWIAIVRHGIIGRIEALLEGDHGAIAKALIAGAKGEISEPARQALRDSGLAHVIAISGFHMAVTAGAMFWLIRALLALVPAIALRFPINSWAAIGALAMATAYLAISGGAVTAIRAYIMVAIIFIAVILNRPALSLRNLAIAALLILAAMPESLSDAGFHMSFAATAALIAFYEARPSIRVFDGWPVLAAVPLMFLIDVATTTLLASAAVDPFAAYHFHRIAVYSVIGNILAMPAVTFVIMPMVLLSLLAMPFGLEAIPLRIMEQGIGAMLAAAQFTSTLPGASLAVPRLAEGALPLMVLGGLWIVIWRTRWRWLGLAAVGAGLALAPFGERPDIWVDRGGELVAIRDQSGVIATANVRKGAFSLERWMEADGDIRSVKEARNSKAFQCDDASCIALVKGKLVSHVHHPSALAEDCRRADILIASFMLSERCDRPQIVIDKATLRERGAHSLVIGPDGIIARTALDERGRRPWVAEYDKREAIPAVMDDRADEP